MVACDVSVSFLNACYVSFGPVFFSTYEECKALINLSRIILEGVHSILDGLHRKLDGVGRILEGVCRILDGVCRILEGVAR